MEQPKKSIWDEFTNLYSLQKTLRFELKPQGKTKELVRTLFINPEEHHHKLISDDLELSKNYKKVKKLIDCMHRNIINNVLSKHQFTGEELKKLDKNSNAEDNDTETDNADKKDPFAKIRERLTKALNEESKIMFDNKLLNPKKGKNKGECELKKWMDKAEDKYFELGNNEKIDKEAVKADMERLEGFFTYFGGFNKNRENVYSSKKIATAIPFRIIHDNFPIFKKNIENYKKITEKHPELAKLLNEKGANEIFQLEHFNKCLTQDGIDVYNNEKLGIIAKEQGKEQDKGINQLINEYAQKKNKEIKENAKGGEKPKKIKIAVFDKLKKQILSISKTKSFQFEVFEDTSDIINGINKRYTFLTEAKEGMSIVDEIKKIIGSVGDEKYSLDEIYLKEKFISTLSKKLFNYSRYIEVALEKWYDDRYDDKINKSGTDKRKFISAKQFSITSIQDAINYYLEKYEKDEELSKKYTGKNIIVDYFKNPTITIEHKQKEEVISEEKDLFKELEVRRNVIQHILNGDYKKDLKEEKQQDGDSEKVKAFLDALLEFNYILNPFIIKDKNLRKEQEKDEEFYNEIKKLQESIFEAEILDLYNQTRNYITKKPYKLDKFKLTFGSGYFLSGWSNDMEEREGSILIKYNEDRSKNYYLIIMAKPLTDDDKKQLFSDNGTHSKICIYEFQKMDMKNFPRMFINSKGSNPAPAIEKYNLPIKTIWADYQKYKNLNQKGKDKFLEENPDFRHNLIGYFKICAEKHESLAPFKHQFSSIWKPTKEYENLAQFYKDTLEACYNLKFENVNFDNISQLVSSGKLHLFKIHNKDFNPGSTGKKNLHTLYWEMLFDEKNLQDVIFKLSGGAELFYREASILKNKIIHKIGEKVLKKFFKLPDGKLEPVPAESIKNLSAYFRKELPEHELTEIDRKYIDNYSIIGKKDDKLGIMKDERFTVDKIQFHCPITINFKSKNKNFINDDVLEYLHKRDDVHIIGLDRGERHLIYLTMINKDGKIVDNMQFSLNELQRRYKINGNEEIQKINYQKLLDTREVSRTEARRNWQTIENIKNLKEGYLSLIVHQLAKLMIEKNAIVVMENLNYGFKDSRARVEKQIYQKFESILIKKLQYLVMDKNNLYDSGGVLSAYQLTNQEVPAYKYISKQNGFLFYVPPDYTSKIDPETGFINLLDTRYYSRKNAVALLNKFDKIYYDRDNKYFRFDFDYNSTDSNGNKNFDKLRVDISELTRTKWSVCSHPAKRSITVQINNKWVRQPINDVTDKLIKLFEDKQIGYESGKCLKDEILKVEDAKFFEDLLRYLSVLLALRHTYTENGVEYDLIISSVEKAPGSNEFFVSGKDNNLPANADANGAYNIARKGLWLLRKLDEIDNQELAIKKFNELKHAKEIKKNGEESKEDKGDRKRKKKWVSQWCPNKEWLAFAQSMQDVSEK